MNQNFKIEKSNKIKIPKKKKFNSDFGTINVIKDQNKGCGFYLSHLVKVGIYTENVTCTMHSLTTQPKFRPICQIVVNGVNVGTFQLYARRKLLEQGCLKLFKNMLKFLNFKDVQLIFLGRYPYCTFI